MAETITTVLAIVLIFVGLPVLVLRINDRVRDFRRRRAHPPASRIAERQAYERRILEPDWASVERHLGRPAPPGLKALYADRSLITQRDLRYADDQMISTFEPLDEQAFDTTRAIWPGAAVIATTDFGDPVHLRAGAAADDTVYLTHHDGGDTEVFAESVTEMYAAVRRQNPEREI